MEVIPFLIKYFDENKVIPASINELSTYFDESFDAYHSIQDLDLQIFEFLLEEALVLVSEDDAFLSFAPREKHLTFMYSLLETLEPEAFWKYYLNAKRKNPLLLKNVLCHLQKRPIDWADTQKWNLGLLDALGVKTYKTILVNHTLAVLFYFSTDESQVNENTDAFIEKSTDVLYKVADPSTLFSILDLTKFLFYTSDIGKRFQQKSS